MLYYELWKSRITVISQQILVHTKAGQDKEKASTKGQDNHDTTRSQDNTITR
jgi:hypothetical protein